MSVCHTITVCVHPVWPIVLYGRMLLHISVQCRTGTQLLSHLSTWKAQVLFWDFPNCIPSNLPVHCWYYSLQEDAYFHTDLKQPSCFSLSTCDIQKVKIAKFIFNRLFYNFFLIFTPNLMLQIVPFSQFPPTASINRLNCLSKFQKISQIIVHCSVSVKIEFTNWHVLGSIYKYNNRSETEKAGHQYWYRKPWTHFQGQILKYCTKLTQNMGSKSPLPLTIVLLQSVLSVDIFTSTGGKSEMCEIYLWTWCGIISVTCRVLMWNEPSICRRLVNKEMCENILLYGKTF
jgi:hypothetical protein